MIIFGGVDGTGVWNDDKYSKIFEYGFIRTLFNSWTAGPRNYERGPVTADNKPSDYTYFSALRTYRHVMSNWKTGESAVFLAGYSRGGAAVIEVAKWLKDKEIPVECLILFDPVDKTGQVGLPWKNTPIVDTVKTVIYAKRMKSAKSRESFGNCGLRMWNGQPTLYKEFFATHGGLGGVPWPEPKAGGFIDEGFPDFKTRVTVAMDRAGANAVQEWSFNQVMDALLKCKERLTKPDDPAKQPGANPKRPGQEPKIHIVQPGDWLSEMAITYYGDTNKWHVIYNHPQNRKTIGPNPNLIKPGQRLLIP